MARSKLATRMTVHVALVLVVTLGAAGFLTIRAQMKTLEDQARLAAISIADSVEGALRQGMRRNSWEELREATQRTAALPEVERIRIIGPSGRVVLSTDGIGVGLDLPLTDAACSGCHRAGDPPRPGLGVSQRTSLDADRRLLRVFSPVLNEPGCSTAACHQHDPGRLVLGLVEVDAPLAPIDALVSDSVDRTLLISAVATVLAALLGGVAVARWLHRPIVDLVQGTRKVAEGDLEHHIECNRTDELGLLCDAFNRMTARLAETRLLLLRSEKLSSLGKLAAGVAHEINNPLTGILSFAEDLRDQMPQDDPRREDCEVIVRETLRCRDIVRQLLDFSRPEAPRHERVALNQVVRQALALISHQADFQNVRVEVLLEPELPFVYAGPGQLQQIALNLLMNARDAVGRRGRISIKTFSHSDADRVELVVDDTGPGVPPELREKIFEPFFSTKEDRGSGIGLGVSRSIAEAHGGHLLVTDAPTGGARFRLIVPTRRPDEPLP